MKAVTCFTALFALLPLVHAAPGPQLPLVFEPNRGQAPVGVDFVARTPQGTVLLSRTGFKLSGGNQHIEMRHGGRARSFEPLDPLGGVSSYFHGTKESQWQTGIPHYGRVRYRNVYPGIDLIYYGNGSRLEYDFVVAPDADARAIEMSFDGAKRVRRDAGGDLLIESEGRMVRQARPHVYQTIGDKRQEVAGTYRISRSGVVGFEIGEYDRSQPLIIDPVLQYATWIGRGGQDSAVSVAVDAAGNAYITGETTSGELATTGVVQNVRAGDQDVFVAKLLPTGAIQYVTYFGGSKPDTGLGIAVDSSGNSYVCGITYSSNFPARNGVRETMAGGDFDSFVLKLNPDGTRVEYATYLGGAGREWASAIAVDAQGGAWVTGWTTSRDFPVQGGYQLSSAGGGEEIFLTRIAPPGRSISYSTYFGGDGRDLSTGIALDSAGGVYVSGATTSTAFPLANAFQSKSGGGQDAFVFKLLPDRNSLQYSTFLGGSADDLGIKIAVDPSGNAYVLGYTNSTNFPVTRGVLQGVYAGSTDLFVTKFGPTGTVDYSTFLGGTGEDWAGGIAADGSGTAYVSGWTNSQNFPSRNPVQTSYLGGEISNQRYDAIVARLSPSGDQILYSSFLGGTGEDKAYAIAVDASNRVLLAGSTTSPNFPVAGSDTNLAQGNADVFVARLSADATVPLLVPTPGSINITARSADASVEAQVIRLSSPGPALTFTTATDVSWLRVSPATGGTPGSVTVQADIAGLSPATYTGAVIIASSANRLTIPVTLTIIAAPVITSVSPSPLPRADADSVITVTGGGYTSTSYVEISGVRASTTFVDVRTLRAVVPASVAARQGNLALVVVNPDARSNTLTIQVVTPSVPVLAPGAVVNAASRRGNAIAPGEIVLVTGAAFGGDVLTAAQPTSGRFPTTFAETRVWFDERPAPILWAQAGQVAVVAPYSLAGRSSTAVAVEYRGQRSTPIQMLVAAAAPALFTADSSGAGQVSAFNENGTINAANRPAARGSIVVLYGTGEGALTASTAEGALVSLSNPPSPVLPVSVSIGGMPAEVLYAGSAPGQITGLFQLNVRVPFGVAAGSNVPVVVNVGSFSSTADATIAVE